jgi:hypothetical protein
VTRFASPPAQQKQQRSNRRRKTRKDKQHAPQLRQRTQSTQHFTSSIIELWCTGTAGNETQHIASARRSPSRDVEASSKTSSKPLRSRFEATLNDEEQHVDTSSTTRISIAFTASTFTVC